MAQTKRCSKCGKVLPMEYFYKNQNKCKKCYSEHSRQYYQEHRVEVAKRGKQYYQEHKTEVAKWGKQYRQKHKGKHTEYMKQYNQCHREKLIKQGRQYYQEHRVELLSKAQQYQQEHKDEIAKRKKQYQQDHKEDIAKRQKQYQQDHKEDIAKQRNQHYQKHKAEIAKKHREYKRKRRQTDIKFNLSQRIGGAISHNLKQNKAGRHWEMLVDYTLDDLKKRLQKTMPRGYTWQDYLDGKLHIDHIIPKSIFNYTKPEHIDFKRCWSLDNLRLLPAKENLSKRDNHKLFQPALVLV